MKSILENSKQLTHSQPETKVEKNPLNLAASWYVAMLSKELGKKPKAIQLFGLDLVAWRDGNGNPVIMERYCSHIGASLAIGEIKDGCIQCPFHHWRFDNSGKCISIPHIEDIPRTARQKTYVTQERYGYIWVWYGTSSPLFPLPELPEAEGESHNYMPCRFLFNTKTTVRRVLENAFDFDHFMTLHKVPTTNIEYTLSDEQRSSPGFQSLIEKQAWFGGYSEATINRYPGPGGVIGQFFGLKALRWTLNFDLWPSAFVANSGMSNKQGKKGYIGLVAVTPIAESQTIRHSLLMIKKTGFFLTDLIFYLVFSWKSQIGLEEDAAIWNTMKPGGGGAFTKRDHALLKFREFYQRWVDKVEI